MRPVLPPRPRPTSSDSSCMIPGGVKVMVLPSESSLTARDKPPSFPSNPSGTPTQLGPPPLRPKPPAASVSYKTGPYVPPRPASVPVSPLPASVSQHPLDTASQLLPPRPASHPAPDLSLPTPSQTPKAKPRVPPRPTSTASTAFPPRPTTAQPSNILSSKGLQLDESDAASWHPAYAKVIRNLADDRRGRQSLPKSFASVNFSRVDAHAIQTPQHETASVARLANYLIAPFEDPIDRIRALFCWIANNVEYDYTGFISNRRSPQDADSVLRSRSSVCEGYANLFLALCHAASHHGHQIEVVKISGAARGAGFQPGDAVINLDAHAWNAVRVNDEWRFIECTWAAGSVNPAEGYVKEYSPQPYFLVNPAHFIETHIPKQDVAHQFLAHPLTHKEWAQLPRVNKIARLNGMRLLNARGLHRGLLSFIEIVDDYLEIRLLAQRELFEATGGLFAGNIVLGRLEDATAATSSAPVWVDNPPHRDSIQSAGGATSNLMGYSVTSACYPDMVECILRGYVPRGDLLCSVMASQDPSVKAYHEALSFRVKNTGPGTPVPPPRVYLSPVMIIEPISGMLHRGERVRFVAKASPGVDAILVAPSKEVRCFGRADANGFQVLEVRVEEVGDWCVGVGDWRSYSFAGVYKVA